MSDFQLPAGDRRIERGRYAIVGGTPAYRRESARDNTPDSPANVDDWVLRTGLAAIASGNAY